MLNGYQTQVHITHPPNGRALIVARRTWKDKRAIDFVSQANSPARVALLSERANNYALLKSQRDAACEPSVSCPLPAPNLEVNL